MRVHNGSRENGSMYVIMNVSLIRMWWEVWHDEWGGVYLRRLSSLQLDIATTNDMRVSMLEVGHELGGGRRGYWEYSNLLEDGDARTVRIYDGATYCITIHHQSTSLLPPSHHHQLGNTKDTLGWVWVSFCYWIYPPWTILYHHNSVNIMIELWYTLLLH